MSDVVFTDLRQGVLFEYTSDGGVKELRAKATRGRAASDKKFYGLIDGAITSWKVGTEPEVIAANAADGREISLNDLVVSSRRLLYFTTLKDPEKGRLSVLDLNTKEIHVLFDGEDEPTLANPNGIALSREERFLYVGISNYDNRKHSGVYCFPIRGDGTIDVEIGKAKKWAAVTAPDGIAVDKPGNVFFTAGNRVYAFDVYGRPWATIRIPKGSGTNLSFGDVRDPKLFITTWNGLYVVNAK